MITADLLTASLAVFKLCLRLSPFPQLSLNQVKKDQQYDGNNKNHGFTRQLQPDRL